MIDMPERTLNNLFGFLQQNEGRLSKRARDNEFSELTPDEVTKIEELYQSAFSESRTANLTTLSIYRIVAARRRHVACIS